MPTLPNAENTPRVGISPSRSVTQVRTGQVSQAIGEATDELSRLATNEINRLDNLRTQDAETQLMRAEMELDQAYKEKKGGDVLSKGFHEESQKTYQSRVDQIKSGLATPQQKLKFDEIAKRRSVSFDASRTAYAMGEAERYEKIQYGARLEAVTERAAADYRNPAQIATSINELETAFSNRMIEQGIKDPDILSTELKTLRGNFYATLVNRALLEQDTQSANAIYASSKGLMSDDQKRAVENLIRPANDFAEGQQLALKAKGMMDSGKSMAEIEEYITKNVSSAGAYSATQTIFTNMQQAEATAKAEAQGTAMELYHSQGSNSAAKARVLSSQEYANLSPEQRVRVLDYMEADLQQDIGQYRATVNFNQSQEDRKLTRQNTALSAKYKSPEAMAIFVNNVQDPSLKDKSRAEIYNLIPEIGIENVNRILAEQKVLKEGAKPLTMDKDLLEAAMPTNLKKNKKAADVDAYNGFVKAALLDWQANNPNKKPTLEEQKAIARSANTEYEVEGSLWNSTYSAYETPNLKGKKAKEAEFKRGIIQAAAARGRTLTQADINTAWAAYLKDNP